GGQILRPHRLAMLELVVPLDDQAGIDAHLAGERPVAVLVEDDVVGALLEPQVTAAPAAEVTRPADVLAVQVHLGVAGRDGDVEPAHLPAGSRIRSSVPRAVAIAVAVVAVAGVVRIARVVFVPGGPPVAVEARSPAPRIIPAEAQAQAEAEAEPREEAAAEEAVMAEEAAAVVEAAAVESAGRPEEAPARSDRVGR